MKLRLQVIRRRFGTAQKQAWPLRFKGPLRNVERDTPRGRNMRALLSAGYDTGLRASELVAIEVEHIMEAIDPRIVISTVA